MSDGGCSFWFILFLLLVAATGSFGYGFTLGFRAHRDRWLDRFLYRLKLLPHPDDFIREFENVIQEKLDLWNKLPDEIDTQFCETFNDTAAKLKEHTYTLRGKNESKWKRVKPFWDRFEFPKVTMATCIQYELTRQKVVRNLTDLLGAVRAW